MHCPCLCLRLRKIYPWNEYTSSNQDTVHAHRYIETSAQLPLKWGHLFNTQNTVSCRTNYDCAILCKELPEITGIPDSCNWPRVTVVINFEHAVYTCCTQCSQLYFHWIHGCGNDIYRKQSSMQVMSQYCLIDLLHTIKTLKVYISCIPGRLIAST